MRDNELFTKDSLSLMSPEGLPWLHLSPAEGPRKSSKLTPLSRLLENDLPRIFLNLPTDSQV